MGRRARRLPKEASATILVQGRHLEITDALRGYTRTKAKRLSRFFAPIRKVDVFFNANRDSTYTAKVIVGLPRNKTIVCSENEKTLTAALDLTIDHVERKLSAFKEKLRAKGGRGKAVRQL